MRREAICLKCGAWKNAPYARCRICNFQPEVGSDDELKSVYLSLGRFRDARQRKAYFQELEMIATRLKRDGVIDIDSSEVERLRGERKLFRSVSYRQVWSAVFRTVLPGVLFLAALWGVIWLLRALR